MDCVTWSPTEQKPVPSVHGLVQTLPERIELAPDPCGLVGEEPNLVHSARVGDPVPPMSEQCDSLPEINTLRAVQTVQEEAVAFPLTAGTTQAPGHRPVLPLERHFL